MILISGCVIWYCSSPAGKGVLVVFQNISILSVVLISLSTLSRQAFAYFDSQPSFTASLVLLRFRISQLDRDVCEVPIAQHCLIGFRLLIIITVYYNALSKTAPSNGRHKIIRLLVFHYRALSSSIKRLLETLKSILIRDNNYSLCMVDMP